MLANNIKQSGYFCLAVQVFKKNIMKQQWRGAISVLVCKIQQFLALSMGEGMC